MNDTKHTPGRWTFGKYVNAKSDIPTASETNARLIAAAPDLLEALQWATKFLDDNYLDSDMPELAMLRAALAKAGVS
jgi:hypothetical protein